MKNFLVALQAIYENLPMILTIIAVIIGIGIRVKRFLRMSAEQKKVLLKEQADKIVELIRQQMLSLVTKAEKEWGGGTGKVKKSWVWEQLAQQYSMLMKYIESGLIDRDVIDKLIEDAVAELGHLRETNANVAAAVEPTKPAEAAAPVTDGEGEADHDGT